MFEIIIGWLTLSTLVTLIFAKIAGSNTQQEIEIYGCRIEDRPSSVRGINIASIP